MYMHVHCLLYQRTHFLPVSTALSLLQLQSSTPPCCYGNCRAVHYHAAMATVEQYTIMLLWQLQSKATDGLLLTTLLTVSLLLTTLLGHQTPVNLHTWFVGGYSSSWTVLPPVDHSPVLDNHSIGSFSALFFLLLSHTLLQICICSGDCLWASLRIWGRKAFHEITLQAKKR